MKVAIDTEKMVSFLVRLLNTPSPTGDTARAMEVVQEAFRPMPFEMSLTPKGILVGTWEGEEQDRPRALTAHVDTLGAIVREIKSNGRLRVSQLGGWRWSSVEGEGLTIFSAGGERYRGSFLPTTASAHAHTRKEAEATRDDTNMEGATVGSAVITSTAKTSSTSLLSAALQGLSIVRPGCLR